MPKTILVVEDFDDIRDAMRLLIEEIHGCVVIEATDGLEAINMAREHRPDLILMDIAMPVFNGIQAASEIRSNPNLRHVRIIAVTSYPEQFGKDAIDSGLSKVFDKPTLLTELDKLLDEIVNER